MRQYKVESDFVYKGLRCVVLFLANGWRCGYVGVPKTHKFYGKSYCEIEKELEYIYCHGGLTFSTRKNEHTYPVESDLWWFGFDCAHYGDGKDLDLSLKYFPEMEEQILKIKQIEDMCPTYEPIREREYVEANCKSLVEQLLILPPRTT